MARGVCRNLLRGEGELLRIYVKGSFIRLQCVIKFSLGSLLIPQSRAAKKASGRSTMVFSHNVFQHHLPSQVHPMPEESSRGVHRIGGCSRRQE